MAPGITELGPSLQDRVFLCSDLGVQQISVLPNNQSEVPASKLIFFLCSDHEDRQISVLANSSDMVPVSRILPPLQ